MRTRSLLIVGLLLVVVLPASAQEKPVPTELPPLLPVPPGTVPPVAGPRGPSGEYDPGDFYLPERSPEGPRKPAACGPDGRFWIAPALELVGTKSAATPALVRFGSPTGPAVFGDNPIAAPLRAGLSIASGLWLNEERTYGVDSAFYFVSGVGSESFLVSNGSGLFLPTASGAFPLADPNVGLFGAYQAGLSTRFTSADVNLRNNLVCGSDVRLDSLVGYSFGRLTDDFELYGKRLGAGGEIVRFRDDVRARNTFHGGQLGLAGEYRLDRWFISGTGKVAFGAVFAKTELDGKFRVDGNVVPIGFYARPDVNGPRSHSQFAVLPTVGVTLGRQLGDHARLFLGYNFQFLNRVTRGPDVLDPTPAVLAANPQTPVASAGTRRDATTSDFWVQSLSLGMEWRY